MPGATAPVRRPAGPSFAIGRRRYHPARTRKKRTTRNPGGFSCPTTRNGFPSRRPETQHFWDGCREGKLLLQRCGDTGRAYFPPRPFSPYTGSRNVSVFEASGRGALYSYVINHRPAKGFEAPYAIAIVQLPEGVRMMTNIVECDQTPEALELDMPLEVCFEKIDDDISLPLWRPARG